MWNFRLSSSLDPELGFRGQWFARPLSRSPNASSEVISMPVPSSYNDVTQNAAIRDFVGWAWYDRTFFAPVQWSDKSSTDVYVRFGSAHYTAVVWVNGAKVAEHVGGHLPFEARITDHLRLANSPTFIRT